MAPTSPDNRGSTITVFMLKLINHILLAKKLKTRHCFSIGRYLVKLNKNGGKKSFLPLFSRLRTVAVTG